MKLFSTKALCRSAIIAALYISVTVCFGELAFGPFQIRPGEALCILPLFYFEAVPGLYIGCMLANLASGYGIYDIFLGSLATLLASLCTYFVGKLDIKWYFKVLLGGLAPVLLNAFAIPAVWILAGSDVSIYWASVFSMIITESAWVYVLGTLLFVALQKLIQKGTPELQPL